MKIRMKLQVISENPPIFKEGWAPGVLGYQELDIDVSDMTDTTIAMGLITEEDKYLASTIKVITTEIVDEEENDKEGT